MLAAVLQFIGIALVALLPAGVPFAIYFYLDYRKFERVQASRLHLVGSP